MAYAEEAVKQGSLAVAASNGRDAVVLCIERPATTKNEDGNNNSDQSSDGRPTTSTVPVSTTATESGTKRGSEGDGVDADHADVERPTRRRRHGGGVRDPGAGVGIVDSANNQDRKLCEVCVLCTCVWSGARDVCDWTAGEGEKAREAWAEATLTSSLLHNVDAVPA